MANKKKEIKLKARKTSLSKKSKEELIDVILKKDKTEKTLNAKISKLTESLAQHVADKNALQVRVDSFDKDLEGERKKKDEVIKTLKDKKIEFDNKEKFLAHEISEKELKIKYLYRMLGVSAVIIFTLCILIVLGF